MQLSEMLKQLVERNGSDLHLVAGSTPTLRIAGNLTPIDGAGAIGRVDVRDLLASYLSERQQTMLDDKADVMTSIVTDETYTSNNYGGAARFRCCAFWDRNGVGASFRVIPSKIPTLAQLFEPERETLFRRLADMRRGLIVVAGMVGSGKSTTTAAMVETINNERAERIFTIEDPIEYVYSGKKSLISQREVGTDVDSYEQGGLSALRSDPDVVVVGEFRTPEAVRIALALADTGHLVFATLQADSVTESVRRLVEAFPDNKATMRRMLARSLNAIIAQRLLPRASGEGRVPANEIMLVNSRIRRMIDEGDTDFTLAIEAGRDQGMCTMDDCVLELYREGTIDYEKAWINIMDRDRLGRRPTE